ncbi:uncharacterized protein KY384_003416 [Bacidia gigantensis]|uniref:uncharacterized protein n=1 Tax=Bacidia gigantensis TaxID=2732470 RepID=UPI001D04AE46|nr:uncharacterized protein KY384_003416 [Bacidia gigantensis]KAG8531780.1 hypothetical protein KY384_003416 [Bacidia gigantensis]
MPVKTISLLLASEAATLKYIRLHSNIPVPEDNDVGVPYILMSKADGIPLADKWKPNTSTRDNRLTQSQMEGVVCQLGVITEALSRLTFDQAGSIIEEGGEFLTTTCLTRGLLLDQRYAMGDIPRGPFKSETDYYIAHQSAYFEHVQCYPLRSHCFLAPNPTQEDYYCTHTGFLKALIWWSDFVTVGMKINGSENRVDYVIAGEVVLDRLRDQTRSFSNSLSNGCQRSFALHHPDLNVDNIFVDKDFKITCLINWQFCSTVPFTTLLIPPGLPQSWDELDDSFSSMFKRGFEHALQVNTAARDVGTKSALCEILNKSRPMWLFDRLLNLNSLADLHLFQTAWDLIDDSTQSVEELLHSQQALQKYKKLHSELRKYDKTESKIALKESRHFRNDTERLAIARKLTLVSEWSSRFHEPVLRKNGGAFVADKRLWKWMLEALKN